MIINQLTYMKSQWKANQYLSHNKQLFVFLNCTNTMMFWEAFQDLIFEKDTQLPKVDYRDIKYRVIIQN